jgi:hypothetical protein
MFRSPGSSSSKGGNSDSGGPTSSFEVRCGQSGFGTELTDKWAAKPLGKTLIEPFIDRYNKQNGTKMTLANVFNITVNGNALLDSAARSMDYPCKALVEGQNTVINIDLVPSCHVIVSAGEVQSKSDIETKHLSSTLESAIVKPFVQHYNRTTGGKKTVKDVKGIEIDGESPNDPTSKVMSWRCCDIIMDPRQTEIRLIGL